MPPHVRPETQGAVNPSLSTARAAGGMPPRMSPDAGSADPQNGIVAEADADAPAPSRPPSVRVGQSPDAAAGVLGPSLGLPRRPTTLGMQRRSELRPLGGGPGHRGPASRRSAPAGGRRERCLPRPRQRHDHAPRATGHQRDPRPRPCREQRSGPIVSRATARRPHLPRPSQATTDGSCSFARFRSGSLRFLTWRLGSLLDPRPRPPSHGARARPHDAPMLRQAAGVPLSSRAIEVACDVATRRYGVTVRVGRGVAGRGLTHTDSWVAE
jgi:hypothetical protein